MLARMIFRQVTHDDLGCASYLIGDDKAGVAAVVDPRFEIEVYLEMARYFHVTIEHVLETHNHADHLSGHGRLAAATGATIHVHRDASPDYDHESFDDGWELELGSVRVKALHTPGHRPEHTAFALSDTRRGDNAPWAVLTGDTLFVGDLNRGPLVTAGPQLLPLAPLQVERARADGALLVDVRTPYQFDDAHVPGAVCIPIVEAGFGTKLAWVADHDLDIILIGRDDA